MEICEFKREYERVWESSYHSARFPEGEITEKERAENVSAQGSRTATFGVRVKTSRGKGEEKEA